MGKLIKCPSGLTGEVRGLSGKELEQMGDRSVQRSGLVVDKLLDACWTGTTDPGLYTLNAAGKPDWSKVLVGDRFFVFLNVRAQTFGSKYDFKVQCTDKACRHRFDWEIDILEDLPVKELAPEDAAAFLDGNRIEAAFGDGRKFWFKLGVGADEVRALRSGNVQSFIGPLVGRIHEIEGVGQGTNEKRQFFLDGGADLSFEALHEMDAHDCGVETMFEVECLSCGNHMDYEVPFDQGFIARRPTRKVRT